MTVSENILRLVPYRPGKPIEEVQRELGLQRVIKLASNENSLGPSPLALAAIRDTAAKVHLYPDAVCHDLREAVSEHIGMPGDQIVFGNGSDDIIHLLGITFLEPGDEAIQADPTFVRYEAAAILNNAICHKLTLLDWTHDLEAIKGKINANTRMIFIANPNNPTGTIVTEGQLRDFMRAVPERAIVVFDEAYFEYVESSAFPDTRRFIEEWPNVVVLRTFSKMYGLAGIRLGYGIASPEIAAHLDRVREPFNVSLIAQAAGMAALKDTDHVARTRAMNAAGKQRLYREFDKMGLAFAPTEANFIWVNVKRDSREVFNRLLRKGIIVRTGDVFGEPTHLRITIGTDEELDLLLEALGSAIT